MNLLVDLEIYEQDAFERAGITLFGAGLNLLKAEAIRAVCFPNSKGTGRLLNLLQWEADGRIEFIDGEGIYADQVFHLTMHRIMDHHLGSAHPQAMLLAECLASASDLYLLGKLSLAGEETDFLADTLESFSSYYELYAANPNQLESLLTQLQNDPYTTMLAVTWWLYDYCCQLLYPKDLEWVGSQLAAQEDHLFLPLVHHYNTANWILTIRAKHTQAPAQDFDFEPIRTTLAQGEQGLMDLLASCGQGQ